MKNSKIFPNGSAADWWYGQWCERCNKYKISPYGIPTRENCKIEEAISESQFDADKWPGDKIISTGKYSNLCTEFESDDEFLMRSYKQLFESEEAT